MTDYSYGIVPVRVTQDTISYLLIQHLQGHWGFPKGHAEPKETAEQSATRELIEETGVTEFVICGADPFIEKYEFEQGGRIMKKTVTYYLARILSDDITIQEDEIRNYKFADYDTAHSLITFNEGKNLLKEVHGYIQGNEERGEFGA